MRYGNREGFGLFSIGVRSMAALCAVFIMTLSGCGDPTVTVSENAATSSTPAATYTATLTWTMPTQRADGSALAPSAIAGYTIYHGTATGIRPNTQSVTTAACGATTCSASVSGLSAGTHYFTVTVTDTTGNQSAHSTERSKTF